MDPDATLKILRQLVKRAEREHLGSDAELIADELAEHFSALDEWISKGGFLPVDWLVMVRQTRP